MDNRYNFKDCPSRTHTGSLKWDRYPEDILPLWVADMDIETAPEIIEAIKRRLDHKVFGYTIPYDSVYDSVIQYLGRVFRREDVHPIIFDLVDNFNSLKRHYYTRKKVYEDSGGEILKFNKVNVSKYCEKDYDDFFKV